MILHAKTLVFSLITNSYALYVVSTTSNYCHSVHSYCEFDGMLILNNHYKIFSYLKLSC